VTSITAENCSSLLGKDVVVSMENPPRLLDFDSSVA
jgi:hypothetical protein